MSRYAMLIDLERCVGCQSCTVACKSEWAVPIGGARTRVRPAGTQGQYPNFKSTFYVSQCNHCDRPTCVPACPTGATYQDSTGTVRVNRELCIGCGSCVAACPYDARYIDSRRARWTSATSAPRAWPKAFSPRACSPVRHNAKTFGDLEDTSGGVFNAVYRGGAKRIEIECGGDRSECLLPWQTRAPGNCRRQFRPSCAAYHGRHQGMGGRG